MIKFICQLPLDEQDTIRKKVINYLNSIEKNLAYKLDCFGNSNIENVMNDTISNLENMIYE